MKALRKFLKFLLGCREGHALVASLVILYFFIVHEGQWFVFAVFVLLAILLVLNVYAIQADYKEELRTYAKMCIKNKIHFRKMLLPTTKKQILFLVCLGMLFAFMRSIFHQPIKGMNFDLAYVILPAVAAGALAVINDTWNLLQIKRKILRRMHSH